MPGFIWILLILIVIYILIIRPLTRPRYPYRRQDPSYSRFPMNGPGGGLGRGLGMLAGGFAAGALLTSLLEQGRIDLTQYDTLQGLPENDLIDQLQSQGIMDQTEIHSVIQDLGTEHGDYNRTAYGGYDTGDDFQTADNISSDYDDGNIGSGGDYGDNSGGGDWI